MVSKNKVSRNKVTKKQSSAADLPATAPPQALYRSGAVARMVRMPVSTLRIWEQRYRAVAPFTAPSGHRLYSAADVQRVALLRQLTDHGHAIGSIAALDAAQLRQVASTHANTASRARSSVETPAAPWRLAVIGTALAQRLQRPGVTQRLARPLQVAAVFETLTDAARAAPGGSVDLLLWHTPGLQVGALPELRAAQAASGARGAAVMYRFAGAAAKAPFVNAGAVVARELADDDAFADWLVALAAPSRPRALGQKEPWSFDAAGLSAGDVVPRRFDDATLTEFAGLSSTIACECPRHVAELLMQLSNFEAYSADCKSLSPKDAALHAYLQRVAGAARALFESALERVALHEGLVLPG